MSPMGRKPPVSWSQHYELMLFDMWEKNLSDLEPGSGKMNIEIYKMMAQKLDDAGFIGIEWKSVCTKLHNITRKYRLEAKEPVSNWIYFNRLNKMLKNWRPENPRNPAYQSKKKSFEEFKTEYEETEYLSGYLKVNGERENESWQQQIDPLSHSGVLNDDLSPPPTRESAGKNEMTAFEARMLAASQERNKELQKLRKALTDIGQRRLGVLERMEQTMNRMEEENAKYHQQMFEKKS
ncbi:uncharacterized protein LOC110187289 [Drosophila serrata]|uniref:uncharacterized protein LOC110187289 n=1 Tax=Drosophila serrata TaxID=7274 RepID=UPI000A1D344C|nr:uncharacterized protein LOC110187289 [Drosophila serrata]